VPEKVGFVGLQTLILQRNFGRSPFVEKSSHGVRQTSCFGPARANALNGLNSVRGAVVCHMREASGFETMLLITNKRASQLPNSFAHPESCKRFPQPDRFESKTHREVAFQVNLEMFGRKPFNK